MSQPLSPLAREIYRQLIRHLKAGGDLISYADLAKAVAKKVPAHHRSPSFHAALTEVTAACRSSQVPALPALVTRASANRPGSGYYAIAHPRAKTDEARVAAWTREHASVIAAVQQYPTSL
ncbi:MAG TPA: hypothetical protein VGM39_12880 [Kofleriaceae bacterium]|jgi:hypothetical protein